MNMKRENLFIVLEKQKYEEWRFGKYVDSVRIAALKKGKEQK